MLKKFNTPHLKISYDEFCKNPERSLNEINKKFDTNIRLEEALKKINTQEYHQICGNLNTFKNIQKLRYDNKWKKQQNLLNKIIGTMITYPLKEKLVYKK